MNYSALTNPQSVTNSRPFFMMYMYCIMWQCSLLDGQLKCSWSTIHSLLSHSCPFIIVGCVLFGVLSLLLSLIWQVWSLADEQPLLHLPFHSSGVVNVQFSPTQDHLLSVAKNGIIKVHLNDVLITVYP